MTVVRPVLVLIFLLAVPILTIAQQRVASIRSIDFANFTYPWPGDLMDAVRPKRTFTLRRGELESTKNQMGVTLEHITYGDVTEDGNEEAVITTSVHTGGSSIPGIVYVYSLRSGRPRPLWYFSTGDRADGGLRKVYAENGNLVVELFGPKKNEEADGRPKRFTRSRYVWKANRFRQKVRKEVIELTA